MYNLYLSLISGISSRLTPAFFYSVIYYSDWVANSNFLFFLKACFLKYLNYLFIPIFYDVY